MSRTITAFYDSRPEAEAAKRQLEASQFDAERVRIIDQSSSGQSSSHESSSASQGGSSYSSSSSSSSSGDSGEGQGFFSSLRDMFMPDEDAHAYDEGIRRGGFLLCAQVDDDRADDAVRMLESSNSVDFDEREQSWRTEGWSGYQSGGSSTGMDRAQTGPDRSFASGSRGAMASGSDRSSDEEIIPIVEERMNVGKREVERGGARVRSYTRETPVHEQVTLHEEHVNVERRPVDRSISADEAGGMFRDRDIEMTETSEEAVIGKDARVTEELVVGKTSEDRTQQIDDTVRRTEVEVDEGANRGGDRSALSGMSGDRQGGMTGDRDRDGTPNALDTTDRTMPGGSREGGLTGDRDRDGTPNALDTTDRNRR